MLAIVDIGIDLDSKAIGEEFAIETVRPNRSSERI
jgi:hypothetical protein